MDRAREQWIVVVEARHSARGGSLQTLGQPEVARCKIEVRRSVSGGAVCMTRDRQSVVRSDNDGVSSAGSVESGAAATAKTEVVKSVALGRDDRSAAR